MFSYSAWFSSSQFISPPRALRSCMSQMRILCFHVKPKVRNALIFSGEHGRNRNVFLLYIGDFQLWRGRISKVEIYAGDTSGALSKNLPQFLSCTLAKEQCEYPIRLNKFIIIQLDPVSGSFLVSGSFEPKGPGPRFIRRYSPIMQILYINWIRHSKKISLCKIDCSPL